jgi:hypothetical protein
MDGTLLQTKVYGGFAKAAQRVGLDYAVYRPASASNPTDPARQIATLRAQFTIHSSTNFSFIKPSDYNAPLYHALVDPTLLHVGDYLIGPQGTFFIASLTPSMPPLAVNCNRVITAWLPGPQVGAGPSGYGGTISSTPGSVADGVNNETAVMTSWPASVLLRSRATKDAYLPADTGSGMFRALVPAWPGVILRTTSIFSDDLGNRYVANVAELQDLGWRMDLQQVVT